MYQAICTEEADCNHHLEAILITDALIITRLGQMDTMIDRQEMYLVVDEKVLTGGLSMLETVAHVVVVSMVDLVVRLVVALTEDLVVRLVVAVTENLVACPEVDLTEDLVVRPVVALVEGLVVHAVVALTEDLVVCPEVALTEDLVVRPMVALMEGLAAHVVVGMTKDLVVRLVVAITEGLAVHVAMALMKGLVVPHAGVSVVYPTTRRVMLLEVNARLHVVIMVDVLAPYTTGSAVLHAAPVDALRHAMTLGEARL